MFKKLNFVLGFVILCVLLFGIGAVVQKEEFVLLEFQYDSGNFVLLNKSLFEGNFPTLNHVNEDTYSLNLISDSGEELYSFDFDPTLLYVDGVEGENLVGGVEILEETEFYLIVPKVENLEKFEISEDGEKIFEEDLYDVLATSCRIS